MLYKLKECIHHSTSWNIRCKKQVLYKLLSQTNLKKLDLLTDEKCDPDSFLQPTNVKITPIDAEQQGNYLRFVLLKCPETFIFQK
jgi:hypothetical protein